MTPANVLTFKEMCTAGMVYHDNPRSITIYKNQNMELLMNHNTKPHQNFLTVLFGIFVTISVK